MTRKKALEKSKILGVGIFVIAVLLSILRCFFAIDNDERLMNIVAIQIAQGQALFGDTWSSYQTSAMLMAPFLKLYLLFHGNPKGIVLAYRLISVMLSLILSIYIYNILKKTYKKQSAYACAITFFLMLPVGAN